MVKGKPSFSGSVQTEYPNIEIRRSVGAKYIFPETIKDTDGTERKLIVGTEVTGIKAIAGAGTNQRIKTIKRLMRIAPGSSAKDWQKLRGTAKIDLAGVEVKAEIHWYSLMGTTDVYDLKVKRYFL